jgi:predicted ATP-grasp superfamily ATP-dependent carboligase
VALNGPILIGFAEALAGPETAASLLAAGLPVAAFTRRDARAALRRHPDIRLHSIAAPERDAAAAVAELVDTARAAGAVALMPLDDPSVWLCDRASAQLAVPVIGPRGEQAHLALDKRVQIHAAHAAGFDVPETRECASAAELADNDVFPVIVKPALALEERDGRLRKGRAHVCADRTELDRAAEAARDEGPLLVQALVRGTGAGLFGLAAGGTVGHWSAHRRLRMVNPQGSGSSACVSSLPDPRLAAAGERMMTAAGWRGLFMLELLCEPSGRAWFMELNGRTWGSLALARRLGLEYPAWVALDALGLGGPPAAVPQTRDTVVCRHLGREIIHLLTVLRGPRSAALDAWPSRWGTVRDVLRVRRADRWYNWSAGHPAVFVDDTVQTIVSAIAPRSRS